MERKYIIWAPITNNDKIEFVEIGRIPQPLFELIQSKLSKIKYKNEIGYIITRTHQNTLSKLNQIKENNQIVYEAK